MKSRTPSLNDWKALYAAAAVFKELKPWNWMSDADLFGVQNPEDGEIGYCCIMGQLGEVFGMAVYRGSEGLDGYLRMQAEAFGPDDPDLEYIQKCLLVSFEDRGALEELDLKTIKRLGLKFRGRNAWPQFRSYLPGYVPWFLTKEETRFLTMVMEQVVDVALRFKKDRRLLTAPAGDLVMVRCLESRQKQWHDTWLRPPSERRAHVDDAGPPDELLLRRIKRKVAEKRGVWEVGYFVLPAPVDEGEKPYFPFAAAVADASTGVILDTWLASPEQFLAEFPKGLLSFVQEAAVLPQCVLVSEPEVFRMMEPIALHLDFGLELVDKLETVEDFKEELCTHMRQA